MRGPLKMPSTLSGKGTHTLLMFDSTRLLRHLSPNDDRGMVDYVVGEYGPALQNALRFYTEQVADLSFHMRAHFNDAYYAAAVDEAAYYSTEDTPSNTPTFFRRTVSEAGVIESKKARYDELVELCIDTFNGEIAAYLRSLQFAQAKQIYTVRVLGYENRILKLLVCTDGPIIP